MDINPIATQIENENAMSDNTTSRDRELRRQNGPKLVTENIPDPNRDAVPEQKDFMGDLVEAQHEFISAQHAFLHNANTSAFAAAQRNLIAAQNEVLQRLGVFG